jgi:hypothetical protein
VSCIFPLVFGGVVYPFTGLNSKPIRWASVTCYVIMLFDTELWLVVL